MTLLKTARNPQGKLNVTFSHLPFLILLVKVWINCISEKSHLSLFKGISLKLILGSLALAHPNKYPVSGKRGKRSY